MSGGWSALLVAVVGVAGTLGAALLTQSRADRTKRMELEPAQVEKREERRHAEELRQAERAEQKAEALVERLRSCCVSLNMASRQYMTAQVNLLHALRNGTGIAPCLEQLETCRIAQRDCYAEAQMVVPDDVLAAAAKAGHRLNEGYGLLKRIIEATPHDQEALNAFAAGIDESWSRLGSMQRRMRRTLGVDGGARFESED